MQMSTHLYGKVIVPFTETYTPLGKGPVPSCRTGNFNSRVPWKLSHFLYCPHESSELILVCAVTVRSMATNQPPPPPNKAGQQLTPSR